MELADEEETDTGERSAWSQVLEAADPAVRRLASLARERIAATLPDADEEVDRAARMLGFTYQPGTYKGLVTAVVVHKSHINIMFSNGVGLREQDVTGLLEGTGKRTRHIKIRSLAELDNPHIRELLVAAAALTPRP